MAMKILVVDDDLHMVHAISYKLRQQDYEVFTAHNGRDGFDLACQCKPDLVVTDFQMPVMSGFEMAVLLGSSPESSELPVIMLTARGHKIPPAEMAKTNIKALMAKPFSSRELIHKIAEYLDTDRHPENGSTDHDCEDGHAA